LVVGADKIVPAGFSFPCDQGRLLSAQLLQSLGATASRAATCANNSCKGYALLKL
jgi:hypothetical protein